MKNKTAIVTGGSGALGSAMAQALSERGYNTIVFDIDTLKNKKFDGTPIIPMEVDVTSESAVKNAVDSIVQRFGCIDVLINNAGNFFNELLVNITNKNQPRHNFQTFKSCLEINLNSTFLVGSIVAEQMMLKRNKGVIVNISSISAQGNVGQSAYSAAKAGVEALTKVWAKELGIFDIRVGAVAPGFMDTGSTHQVLDEGKLNLIRQKTPLRRLGEADHVVQAVFSIIDNEFINGTVISVNGGFVL